MKDRGASLLTIFLIRFLLIGLVAADVSLQGTSKEISTPSTGSQTVDLNGAQQAPPDIVKGGSKDIEQDGVKDKEKSTSNGKDKPLEEPKASGELRKGSFGVESYKKKPHNVDVQIAGCDPSNRCMDKKNNLVACLRVPGIDTQALSLVIQNKGKGSLDVKILAPSFVNLEQSEMQIKAKEDKEVKVYVNEDSAEDSMIILQAGGGNCSLDFRNIIPNSISKSEALTMSKYIRTSTSYALLCIFVAAAVVTGVGWLCFRFRPLLRREACPKYQKLEAGLPVSTGGKKEADGGGDDGWEDNWENGWDEEEVPVTPSEPISSPSLKGLASRRFIKDGWKD